MGYYLDAIKSIKIPTSIEEVWGFFNNITFPVAVLAIGLIVLFAIQGYKIFHSFLYVASCIAFAYAGHLYLAPLAAKFVTPYIPSYIPINVDIIVALLCAITAFLITKYAYRFMVFILGGGVGYVAGYFFVAGFMASKLSTLSFLNHWIANIVVGIVLGLMCALFFAIAFKHIYILGFSIGGMGLAGYIIYKLVLSSPNNIAMFCFVGVACVIGIFAAHHQYVEEDKCTEFYF